MTVIYHWQVFHKEKSSHFFVAKLINLKIMSYVVAIDIIFMVNKIGVNKS